MVRPLVRIPAGRRRGYAGCLRVGPQASVRASSYALRSSAPTGVSISPSNGGGLALLPGRSGAQRPGFGDARRVGTAATMRRSPGRRTSSCRGTGALSPSTRRTILSSPLSRRVISITRPTAASGRSAARFGRYPEWGRDGNAPILEPRMRCVEYKVTDGMTRAIPLGLESAVGFRSRDRRACGGANHHFGRARRDRRRRDRGQGRTDHGSGKSSIRRASSRVIDLKGKTVMPGLVDAHAHNHITSPDLIRSHNPQSAKYLAYGVTTAHDPAGHANMIFQVAEMTKAGRILGPRLYSAGLPLFSWGPQPPRDQDLDDAVQNVQSA